MVRRPLADEGCMRRGEAHELREGNSIEQRASDTQKKHLRCHTTSVSMRRSLSSSREG